jgi:hypothetical protein
VAEPLLVQKAMEQVEAFAETFGHPASPERIVIIALDVARQEFGDRIVERLLLPHHHE